MISKAIQAVEDFHRAAGQEPEPMPEPCRDCYVELSLEVSPKSRRPSDGGWSLSDGGWNLISNPRLRLMVEELQEIAWALRDGDRVELADGLADLLYVVIGTAVHYNVPLDAVFTEVHRSNMTKFPSHLDEFGKLVKPGHYSPADVASIMEAHDGQAGDTE